MHIMHTRESGQKSASAGAKIGPFQTEIDMSTATTIGQTIPESERPTPARHGRPPFESARMLIEAVREGLATSSRYEALRRQGVSHADAIGRAMAARH